MVQNLVIMPSFQGKKQTLKYLYIKQFYDLLHVQNSVFHCEGRQELRTS
jgi:hypothetical protein